MLPAGRKSFRTLRAKNSTFVRFCQAFFAGLTKGPPQRPFLPQQRRRRGRSRVGQLGPLAKPLTASGAGVMRSPFGGRKGRQLGSGEGADAGGERQRPGGGRPRSTQGGQPPRGRDDRSRRTRTTTAWGREGGRAGDSEPPAKGRGPPMAGRTDGGQPPADKGVGTADRTGHPGGGIRGGFGRGRACRST